MANWYIRHKVDFERSPFENASCEVTYALMMPGDNEAHVWVVSVFSGGEPVDITGETVQAFFTRSDGNTVAVTGTATGNAARVTLPRDCYLYRGELRAVMRLGDSVSVVTDPVTTLKECSFFVKQGFGNIVDPEDSFPTVSGLATDVATVQSAVGVLQTALNTLDGKVTGGEWLDLGAASGVSAGTTGMGTNTGYVCAYRVDNGNHVTAAANVALSFAGSAIALSSSAIPTDYMPSSRIIRICPVNGAHTYCRAYVSATDGLLYFEAIGQFGSASIVSSMTVTWTDIIIDWYV